MSQEYGTKTTAVRYQTKALQKFFQKSMYVDVTNREFTAQNVTNMKDAKRVDKKYKEFVITTLTGGGWKSTNGKGQITYNKVQEVISRLVVDQFLEIADEIPSVAAFASSVNDPDSEIINQAGKALYEDMDKALLQTMYGKAASGQWVGTSYATGTVAIAADTGVVTGAGTTFTSAMVGRPFRAAGHTKWYRIASVASTTSLTIIDDSDDTAAAYSGGAISAGATYEIQAATAANVTKTDVAQHLIRMSAILDDAGVPNDGKRWIALPAIYAKPVLLNAPEFNTDIERVHESVKEKGLLLRAYGFNLYFRPASWFVGNNTTGFYCPGGHTSFITGAYGYIEDIAVITAEKNPLAHSDLVKGLFGHGEKVADERRKCGVTLYAKFN